jgi:hypothetical protein
MIGIDNLAFGEPHKYVFLNPNETEKLLWDNGVNSSDKKFRKQCHNIFL